jgi:hypothetical protein
MRVRRSAPWSKPRSTHLLSLSHTVLVPVQVRGVWRGREIEEPHVINKTHLFCQLCCVRPSAAPSQGSWLGETIGLPLTSTSRFPPSPFPLASPTSLLDAQSAVQAVQGLITSSPQRGNSGTFVSEVTRSKRPPVSPRFAPHALIPDGWPPQRCRLHTTPCELFCYLRGGSAPIYSHNHAKGSSRFDAPSKPVAAGW